MGPNRSMTVRFATLTGTLLRVTARGALAASSAACAGAASSNSKDATAAGRIIPAGISIRGIRMAGSALALAGRHLPARALPLLAHLLGQLVGGVVLVDIAHVGGGLDADLLRDHQLDVVEPFVRVEPLLLRLLAHLGDVARSGVV